MATGTHKLRQVGRIPAPGDNAAIALRTLEAGTRISHAGHSFSLPHTVLEGHRFAIERVYAGQPLLSWGLPFGTCVTAVSPGDYICNQKILHTLRLRTVPFVLPERPNFIDMPLAPYALREDSFSPGIQVTPYTEPEHFLGYSRSGGRGVGTRNYIVILGLTSGSSGYARALEERLRGASLECEHIDGIVGVTHTEGGAEGSPNNLELLLRTLSGFIVHPNVGAVLAIGDVAGAVSVDSLQRYMSDHGYPLSEVLHTFLTPDRGFEAMLRRGETMIRSWLPEVDRCRRTQHPLSGLKVALQCGGSDAFSGVSANPLVAWVAREILRHGGSANLAETDELIGAEQYVLSNVRDIRTARAFLDKVERFKRLAGWHGHTAEGNPTGGNNYRGLYNISLKSIGAATKRHPNVRLDYVLEYGERMAGAGYYFMDSPGNDLESVAGQVASGANLIFFTTGNGSVTNFPFVPTIKVVSTTRRYDLLAADMDVNAGEYLDGTPMEELGERTLELALRTASGERTAGEKAGHSQVSIWRNWEQNDCSQLRRLQAASLPSGEPLRLREYSAGGARTFAGLQTRAGICTERIGLVMPASLCAGQIARKIADRLNAERAGGEAISRFVALPHTEGCGVSSGASESLYIRTLLGHLTHPDVALAMVLEHGCEKTHNDYIRQELETLGIPADRFGWASVQLDGGIVNVVEKAVTWFRRRIDGLEVPQGRVAELRSLRLGVSSVGEISDSAGRSLGCLCQAVVGEGGTVVVPETATFLASMTFRKETMVTEEIRATLAYGQPAECAGFHVMEAPATHWIETATGLGATGVQLILVHAAGSAVQAHRMIPLLQVSTDPSSPSAASHDLDLVLTGNPATWTDQLLALVLRTASRAYAPKLYSQGNVDFQITRGLLGVSM